MKILFVDSDTDQEAKSIRAGWLRKIGHEVSIASGIDVPLEGYDLVIVNLGAKRTPSDMRGILATADIAHKRENLGINFLYTGIDDNDRTFALTHRASYCNLYELSSSKSCTSILGKSSGESVYRAGF